MTDEKRPVNVYPQDGYPAEVIVREGEAPHPRKEEPTCLTLTGRIDAPLNFVYHLWNTDQLDKERAVVIVKKEKYQIVFQNDFEDPYSHVVTGHLTMPKELREWPINNGQKFTPLQLAEFLKFHRNDFEDRKKSMELVAKLKQFTAKINTDLEKTQSDKGHSKDLKEETVNHQLEESFTLLLPLVKGDEPVRFEVELNVYSEAGSVNIMLESPELKEKQTHIMDTTIDEYAETIGKYELCVLYE